MGLFRLAANKVARIFGVRVTRRMRGQLYSLLDKLDHGHHVLRVYCKGLVGRMYEKFSTFLRLEICVNRLKDLGLKKGLDNLETVRQRLISVTDRFAGFEAESLNVHVDFPLFQRLALPIVSGKTKIPGITSLNWGTNVSPEHHDKGFTHCFVLTFASAKDRDTYLTHDEHKAFGKILGPVMADVMVIDFWAKE